MDAIASFEGRDQVERLQPLSVSGTKYLSSLSPAVAKLLLVEASTPPTRISNYVQDHQVQQKTQIIPFVDRDCSRSQLHFDTLTPGEAIAKSVAKIHSAAAACHAHLSGFDIKTFSDVYRNRCEGKANSERILDIVALVHQWEGVPGGDVEIKSEELRPHLSMLLVLPLIERALYDIHASEMPTGTALSSLILRDIIASEQIQRALGDKYVVALKTIFSPHGLNLRNVVWHGFVTAEELPRALVSLLVMLFLSLPTPSRPPEQIKALGSLLATPAPDDPSLPPAPDEDEVEALLDLVRQSPFALPGHKKSLLQAIQHLAAGHEHLFLVGSLPALEHGLRVAFASANGAPHMVCAEMDRYYSTLDGFGQRSKHQILLSQELHPECAEGVSGAANRLPQILGPGATGALLDLFLLEGGCSLRGRVSHGEVEVAPLATTKEVSRASRLLCAILVTLLVHYAGGGSREQGGDYIEIAVRFIGTYCSYFHPRVRWYTACKTSREAWETLHSSLDSLTIEWDEDREGGLCRCGSLEVRDSAQQLRKVEASCAAGDAFSELFDALVASREVEAVRECMFGAVEVNEGIVTARYAALRSLEMLYADCTALECVIQTAEATTRLCGILLARNAESKELVESRKASTSQRRSLLTQTALLPGIVAFLRSVMLMLEIFTSNAANPIGVKFATSCMGIVGKIEKEVEKQGLADAMKVAAQFVATKAVKGYQKALDQQQARKRPRHT